MAATSRRPPCPRCGATRLIGRCAVLSPPHLQDGVPLRLFLRWRLGGRKGAIVRYHYVCEMCRHCWRADEWAPD